MRIPTVGGIVPKRLKKKPNIPTPVLHHRSNPDPNPALSGGTSASAKGIAPLVTKLKDAPKVPLPRLQLLCVNKISHEKPVIAEARA